MIKVYPRKKLDISFRNILYGIICSFNYFSSRLLLKKKIQSIWSGHNTAVGLSVRTMFDALLCVEKFQKDSEIIMSGITIPDMVKIVQAHGLNVVPVDIEMDSLEIDKSSLENAITDKTVMIVIAHLFGSRMNMKPIYNICKNRPDIMIIEDCAQAYCGMDDYVMGSETDVSLFSFGSIKSITALGCAIGFFKNYEKSRSIEMILNKYRILSNTMFFKKLIKYLFLTILTQPHVYGIFIKMSRIFKIDYDSIIINSIRNFRNENFLKAIRNQPSNSQLQFLYYRITRTTKNHFQRRKNAGDYIKSKLQGVKMHGIKNETHTYWLFPIKTSKRDILVEELIDNGFDATFTSTQLIPIKSSKTEIKTPFNCKKYMNETIYLPVYETITRNQLHKLAHIVNNITREIN